MFSIHHVTGRALIEKSIPRRVLAPVPTSSVNTSVPSPNAGRGLQNEKPFHRDEIQYCGVQWTLPVYQHVLHHIEMSQ